MSPVGRYVGVDVIDLEDRRCADKHEDERFLGRVLGDAERARVRAAQEPAEELWRIWAAKEAAFKVVSKLRGFPPPFVHARFRVEPHRDVAGFGIVLWEEIPVHVHWHVQPGRIAALGWDGRATDEPVEWGWGPADALDPDPGGSMDALLIRLTERERRPIHSRGSVLVRLAARAALATALGVDESRLEVVSSEGPKGRTPPEVWLDGAPAPADVSLSHHGRWLGWGLRLADPVGPSGARSAV